MHDKIENIDQLLEQLNEKLCHAVAVLASKNPRVYHHLQPNQQGITLLWKMLGEMPETIPMYNYFCAKMALADRDYLLLDIIQKIKSNAAIPSKKSLKR
jgi:hypothetical protein